MVRTDQQCLGELVADAASDKPLSILREEFDENGQ